MYRGSSGFLFLVVLCCGRRAFPQWAQMPTTGAQPQTLTDRTIITGQSGLGPLITDSLLPAVLTGFALAFARAIGEYGSIVFISGNVPFKTEIAPYLIVMRLEEYDYTGAIALAVVLLVFSFLLLGAINLLENWSSRFER
jgi:hypothetical protein